MRGFCNGEFTFQSYAIKLKLTSKRCPGFPERQNVCVCMCVFSHTYVPRCLHFKSQCGLKKGKEYVDCMSQYILYFNHLGKQNDL